MVRAVTTPTATSSASTTATMALSSSPMRRAASTAGTSMRTAGTSCIASATRRPAILGSFLVTQALTYSPAGTAIYDRVTVEFPYEVTVQDQVLEPGQYTIEEHRGSGNAPIVHVFRGDEMIFETSAMTINATDNQIKEDTSVELQRIGDQPGETTAAGTEIYGIGALLLAGTEVMEMAR